MSAFDTFLVWCIVFGAALGATANLIVIVGLMQ